MRGLTRDFAVIDQNVATNLREAREAQGLSQDELAQRMTDRGFGFSQATIWKIETGKRPVKISEVAALADAVGLYTWTSLASEPTTARLDVRLQAAHTRAADAYDALKTAATAFLEAQFGLAFIVHEIRTKGVAVEPLWTSWLEQPAERAVVEARVAEEQGGLIEDRLIDEVDKVMQALREHGYEPTIDPDQIIVTGGGSTGD